MKIGKLPTKTKVKKSAEYPIAPSTVISYAFDIKENRNKMIHPGQSVSNFVFQLNDVIESGPSFTEATLKQRNGICSFLTRKRNVY
ncbi:hypothetical protein TNCV_2382571 [Trichonephila clavipes]|nr:hypothetical protein TNCV_2382571 [Trichonephila clavipes]